MAKETEKREDGLLEKQAALIDSWFERVNEQSDKHVEWLSNMSGTAKLLAYCYALVVITVVLLLSGWLLAHISPTAALISGLVSWIVAFSLISSVFVRAA